jgi:hypothetical protein
MDFGYPPSLSERMTYWWQRGLRLARRLAIAFGLGTLTAIFVGAAVTDNAFVQILVTMLAALGLWLPWFVAIAWVEGLFERRGSRRAGHQAPAIEQGSSGGDHWRRLLAVAPSDSDRIRAISRSLETSRRQLGRADLDPDAHDLCVLIDRRLPELIDRELDNLPPDDRNRRRQLGELVSLVEQFARHCSRKRSGEPGTTEYEAAVLRRRFEQRLSEL